MMDVMDELQLIGPKVKAGDLKGSLQEVKLLWEKIPEPKEGSPNAYMIVEYGCRICLRMGDFEQAMTWAKLGPPFNESRHDCGESEFLIGRVHFFANQFEEAKRYFIIANKKSRGRLFIGENPEFKKLLKK